MKLIDTHTHLYLPEFDADRETVLKNAFESGLDKIFLPNIDSGTIKGMLDLCDSYPGKIFPMMGLHPGSVKEDYQDELKIVKEHIDRGGFLAVGEIGIDLYWDKTYLNQQLIAFKSQIEYAIAADLPIVIHARNSFNEIFEVLDTFKSNGIRGVFHSFTGGLPELERIRQYDFYIGINGIVTFKNSGLAEVIKQFPLNRILLETDSPYLSPVPKRGMRNESAHLVYINDFMANLFSLTPEKFAEISSDNAAELFNLI